MTITYYPSYFSPDVFIRVHIYPAYKNKHETN